MNSIEWIKLYLSAIIIFWYIQASNSLYRSSYQPEDNEMINFKQRKYDGFDESRSVIDQSAIKHQYDYLEPEFPDRMLALGNDHFDIGSTNVLRHKRETEAKSTEKSKSTIKEMPKQQNPTFDSVAQRQSRAKNNKKTFLYETSNLATKKPKKLTNKNNTKPTVLSKAKNIKKTPSKIRNGLINPANKSNRKSQKGTKGFMNQPTCRFPDITKYEPVARSIKKDKKASIIFMYNKKGMKKKTGYFDKRFDLDSAKKEIAEERMSELRKESTGLENNSMKCVYKEYYIGKKYTLAITESDVIVVFDTRTKRIRPKYMDNIIMSITRITEPLNCKEKYDPKCILLGIIDYINKKIPYLLYDKSVEQMIDDYQKANLNMPTISELIKKSAQDRINDLK